MIYSEQNGDYKFPGGGIENDETHEEALIREVQEECGSFVSVVETEIGKVIEYNKPVEKEYDLFKMTSYYYLCRIKEDYCELNLDQYEKDLGFKPVWIQIEEAIQRNKLIITSNDREAPRWTGRDTFVLEYVLDKLKKSNI